jgi:hypothetical protein
MACIGTTAQGEAEHWCSGVGRLEDAGMVRQDVDISRYSPDRTRMYTV